MSPATRPRRILIIDDDDALTGALVRLLQAEGYHVRCAADGEEGIRLASRNRRTSSCWISSCP